MLFVCNDIQRDKGTSLSPSKKKASPGRARAKPKVWPITDYGKYNRLAGQNELYPIYLSNRSSGCVCVCLCVVLCRAHFVQEIGYTPLTLPVCWWLYAHVVFFLIVLEHIIPDINLSEGQVVKRYILPK